MNSDELPDLHMQRPFIALPIEWIGHRGIRRMLVVRPEGTAVALSIDLAVSLTREQRGGHMSRLLAALGDRQECEDMLTYALEVLSEMRILMPDSPAWSLRLVASYLVRLEQGLKPIDEAISLVQKGELLTAERGVSFQASLACPQAQAATASLMDIANLAVAPTHNQLCKVDLAVVGTEAVCAGVRPHDLLLLGEQETSGPVRESFKRVTEAAAVLTLHSHARFAEDSVRALVETLCVKYPDASDVRADLECIESIYEYPLYCSGTAQPRSLESDDER